jgi:hypothetical protein
MTNVELNKLSVAELRELRNRVTEMLQLKMQLEGKLNKDTLQVGMTVRYIGGKNKIKNETFVIEKIKSVNALCKSNVTGTKWNINLANIEQCSKDIDLPDSCVKNEINLDLLGSLKNYKERNPEGFQA